MPEDQPLVKLIGRDRPTYWKPGKYVKALTEPQSSEKRRKISEKIWNDAAKETRCAKTAQAADCEVEEPVKEIVD